MIKDHRQPPAPSIREEDEGFLSRWSRLKSRDRDDAERDLPDEPHQVLTPVDTVEPVAEVYQPTDEDMPPLETLDEHSDYSGFMSPRVSEELRRLALRKLFHTAAFHIRDGLDDYDQDFTQFTPLGDTVTADMKFHAEMEELKRQRQAQEALELEARDPASGEQLVQETRSQEPLAEEPLAQEPLAQETPSQADETMAESGESGEATHRTATDSATAQHDDEADNDPIEIVGNARALSDDMPTSLAVSERNTEPSPDSPNPQRHSHHQPHRHPQRDT